MENSKVVVVMVPLPVQGHLNSLLHLSYVLSSYNLPIHFLSTATHNRQAKIRVHGWNPTTIESIHFNEFKIPEFESPPPKPNSSKFPSHLIPLFKSLSNFREPFLNILSEIASKAQRVIVVHDYLVGSVVQDVVMFENVESYAYHAGSAFSMFSYVWEHKGRPNSDDVVSYMQDVKIPTVQDIIPEDLHEFVSSVSSFEKFNSGNIHNTWKVIEDKSIEFLSKERFGGSTKQWAMGPCNRVSISNDENIGERHKSLKWLDKQAQDSVIYVSFGTTTTLSNEQIQELAIGLVKSEQKFIWVLRDADKSDIFKGEVRRIELPKGLEETLEGKGLVVREWAPQSEILAHFATGGFISHCGWNSSLESIRMGVPFLTWPMHTDQPRNAVLITDILKIGVKVRDWEHRGELVTSSTIEKSVRKLMASDEGYEIRKRASKLGEDVRKSMEEGGVTRMEIDTFVAHITR